MGALDSILTELHSDEARCTFLQRMYYPGNSEVADKLLTEGDPSGILEREINYARVHGPQDRFNSLAKQLIDQYIKGNHLILIENRLKEWKQPQLAGYALSQVEAMGSNLPDFSTAANIATLAGSPEKSKEFLEQLLQSQLADKEYKFTAAKTLMKLGRYKQAIDRYLECEQYHFIGNALDLAQQHQPERVREIAVAGFKRFADGKGYCSESLYLRCMKMLGKTEEARRTLLKNARGVKIKDPPRFYSGLVFALMGLEETEAAKTVVAEVAEYTRQRGEDSSYGRVDIRKELAQLYHTVGEHEEVKRLYSEIISIQIKARWHPSHPLQSIDEAIRVTGDATFEERRLEVFELHGDYTRATEWAEKLGKREQVLRYTAMAAMVKEAEQHKKKKDSL